MCDSSSHPVSNITAANIHCYHVESYRSEAMTCQHVTKWIKLFKEGSTGTHDEDRSGRPSVILENRVQQIKEKVCNDHCVTLVTLTESFSHIS